MPPAIEPFRIAASDDALEDLRRRGVETVPALYLPPGTEADLGELGDRLG